MRLASAVGKRRGGNGRRVGETEDETGLRAARSNDEAVQVVCTFIWLAALTGDSSGAMERVMCAGGKRYSEKREENKEGSAKQTPR